MGQAGIVPILCILPPLLEVPGITARMPLWPTGLGPLAFTMTPRSFARVQLIGAAVLFSTGGAAIKAVDLTGWQIASFRSGVAALGLLLMTSAARRG